jgi:signal transduction histidine kinase
VPEGDGAEADQAQLAHINPYRCTRHHLCVRGRKHPGLCKMLDAYAPVIDRIAFSPAVVAAAEDAGLDPQGVRLVRDIPARLAVHADGDQLHRILVNLMRNARQAIEADPTRKPGLRGSPGKVRVSATQEPGWVIIRLADDGPGIPLRLSGRLFEPFVSGSGSEGTGLGLTISRELAANHGGELRLVETGPGGTTFELRLPAEQAARISSPYISWL